MGNKLQFLSFIHYHQQPILDVCSADDIWSELTLNNDAPIKVAIRKPCWSWQNISSQKSGQKCCLPGFFLACKHGLVSLKIKEELILLIGRLFPVVRPDMSYKMKEQWRENKMHLICATELPLHMSLNKEIWVTLSLSIIHIYWTHGVRGQAYK